MCGEGLVPVTVYSGKVLNIHVSTKVQDINTKVRTTMTTYTDIKPLYVGYCLACARRAHEAKQEQKAAEKPKPKYLAVGIVCALLLIPGVIGAVRLVGSLGRVGLWGVHRGDMPVDRRVLRLAHCVHRHAGDSLQEEQAVQEARLRCEGAVQGPVGRRHEPYGRLLHEQAAGPGRRIPLYRAGEADAADYASR